MTARALFLLPLVACCGLEPNEEIAAQLLKVRRIHVDRMNGGETASHIRDMIIGSLQRTGLFLITENPDKADAYLRGSAEDLVFTDTFQTSEGVNARVALGTGSAGSSNRSSRGPYGNIGVGENESSRIAERKHEAVASVRIVNKDGDVIWSTTKESVGAKFKGASADVADRITRQLTDDYELAKKKTATAASAH